MHAADVDYFSARPFAGIEPSAALIPVACLPGYLCSPAVFLAAGAERARAARVQLLPISWMAWPNLSLTAVADRIAAELRAHVSGPVILAGHSGSGPVALLAFLRHPDLIAGLMLASTGPNFRDHLDVHDVLRRLCAASAWEPEFLDEYIDSCFAARPGQRLTDHLARYASSIDFGYAVQVLTELIETDVEADLRRVTIPAAIIHGRADGSRPVSHAERLAAGIPGSRLFLLNCGHTPMIEDPAGYWQALSWLVAQAYPVRAVSGSA
jgi:pimeloyl-ACP methyl ester carboxylesterase